MLAHVSLARLMSFICTRMDITTVIIMITARTRMCSVHGTVILLHARHDTWYLGSILQATHKRNICRLIQEDYRTDFSSMTVPEHKILSRNSIAYAVDLKNKIHPSYFYLSLSDIFTLSFLPFYKHHVLYIPNIIDFNKFNFLIRIVL